MDGEGIARVHDVLGPTDESAANSAKGGGQEENAKNDSVHGPAFQGRKRLFFVFIGLAVVPFVDHE
jgi:hypothetical protein